LSRPRGLPGPYNARWFPSFPLPDGVRCCDTGSAHRAGPGACEARVFETFLFGNVLGFWAARGTRCASKSIEGSAAGAFRLASIGHDPQSACQLSCGTQIVTLK